MSIIKAIFFCLCRKVIILMDLDVVKTADAVGGKIGNPVQYAEGKKPASGGL